MRDQHHFYIYFALTVICCYFITHIHGQSAGDPSNPAGNSISFDGPHSSSQSYSSAVLSGGGVPVPQPQVAAHSSVALPTSLSLSLSSSSPPPSAQSHSGFPSSGSSPYEISASRLSGEEMAHPTGPSMPHSAASALHSHSHEELIPAEPLSPHSPYPESFPAYLDSSFGATRIVDHLSATSFRFIKGKKEHEKHPHHRRHHHHRLESLSESSAQQSHHEGSAEDQSDPDIQRLEGELKTTVSTIAHHRKWIDHVREQIMEYKTKMGHVEKELDDQLIEERRLRLLLKNQRRLLARKRLEGHMNEVKETLHRLQKEEEGVTGQKHELVALKRNLKRNIFNLQKQIGILHEKSEEEKKGEQESNVPHLG